MRFTAASESPPTLIAESPAARHVCHYGYDPARYQRPEEGWDQQEASGPARSEQVIRQEDKASDHHQHAQAIDRLHSAPPAVSPQPPDEAPQQPHPVEEIQRGRLDPIRHEDALADGVEQQ